MFLSMKTHFYPHQRRGYCIRSVCCLIVCYLRKSKIFQVYWLVACVILSVCLSVCFYVYRLQVTILNRSSGNHHMVEFTVSKNATVFEVIGQHRPKVKVGRISKIVNFHRIDLKFKEELHSCSLNSTNYF